MLTISLEIQNMKIIFPRIIMKATPIKYGLTRLWAVL